MPRAAVSVALCALIGLAVQSSGCGGHREPAAGGRLRIGFFPNVTHAAALLLVERGELARQLSPMTIEPKAFNAGPEAMEALFAGALDACFVGPAPAINGWLRSKGEALVVVAGAAADGAGLVVRPAANIHEANDLHHKKLATPQLGNTQDVALRTYLRDEHLTTRDRGGDVMVLPLANADSFALFKRGELDGAWVPEPWLSRLVDEAGGQLFVDERDRWPEHHFPTTLLVVTKALADEKPDVVRTLVAAHAANVAWMNAHPDDARRLADAALQKWAKKKLPEKVLADAWTRVRFTTDPMPAALRKQVADARVLGLLPSSAGAQADSLAGLVDARFTGGAR
jgi:NitT/TauT family transport system substrate-binding protein